MLWLFGGPWGLPVGFLLLQYSVFDGEERADCFA